MSCQFPLRRTSMVTGSPLPKLCVHLIFRVVPAVQVIPDKLGSVTVTEGVPVTTWKFPSNRVVVVLVELHARCRVRDAEARRRRVGRQANLTEDAIAIAVLSTRQIRLEGLGERTARPGQRRISVVIHRNCGEPLIPVHEGVHLGLVLDLSAIAVIAPCEHRRAGIVSRTLPGHDEVPRAVAGDSGKDLATRGVRIDLEFTSDGSPCAVEALAEHAVVVVRVAETVPDNDEVSG